ncbi:MAG TPA: hypothetical protein EYO24_00930 [Candidatus Marinimicrobia bacterium]|nr:hypothetical protein [Candidatus Neomarinimicrobiota bacterium]
MLNITVSKNNLEKRKIILELMLKNFLGLVYSFDTNDLQHYQIVFLNGYDDSDKKGEAISLLLWNGILLAKEKNLTFDFEGSMVPGIAEFFRSFGSEASTYYQVVKVKPSLLKFYFFLRGIFQNHDSLG